MPTKKFLYSWAIVGAAIPLLLATIAMFIPQPKSEDWNPWEKSKPSSTRNTLAVIGTSLYPAVFVVGVLSLAVTDGGGDSGAPVAGTIIFAISVLLNAALYTVVGWLVWTIARLFRREPN